MAKQQKTDLLKHLLRREDSRSALVFTRTKHGAKRLAQQLDRDNFFVTSLQGNLSQNKRQQALDGFRLGKFHVLVATDIAARGIDVTRVSHVINYDVPSTGDAYTHRIGRTGRAERSGRAYTFVTEEDDKAVRVIERELGMRLERLRIDGFDYQREGVSSAGNASSRGSGRSGGQGSGRSGRQGNGRPTSGRGGGQANGRTGGSSGSGGRGQSNGRSRGGRSGRRNDDRRQGARAGRAGGND